MIKVFESFAGYGGASFALSMANIKHQVVGFSEINKQAIQTYCINHGNTPNYGDITTINPHDLPNFDLFTGGFPCQPFSAVSKGKGVNDSRGLLFNDIVRILAVKRPMYILLENVKGITFKKHQEFFEYTKHTLKTLGYDIDVRLYNSLDYGTPQSRQRIYYVGRLYNLNYTPPAKSDAPHWQQYQDTDYNNCKNYAIPHNRSGSKIIKYNINRGRELSNRNPTAILYRQDAQTSCAGLIPFGNHWRYLTNKEVFRLQGFFNDEINIDHLSKRQAWKLAGNGWDVNLVKQIMQQLLD